jgi:solute:Na+ symporter, SSS family
LFLPRISAVGAKAALFIGLAFYILTSFVFKVDIHFVHLWGIEFVLNMLVMFGVSYFYPNTNTFKPTDIESIQMHPWKYARHLGLLLVVLTVAIYIWLGQ